MVADTWLTTLRYNLWINNLAKVTGAVRICYMNKIGKLKSYNFVLILNSQKAPHIELWGVFYEFFGEKIPRNIKSALHCPMSCRCNAVCILAGYIERFSDRVRVDCLILCVDIINNISQNMAMISFRVPFAIYGVVCVELVHWSLGDRENIFITHLIITIKSEVSIFPIVVIFFRGCLPEIVVPSYTVGFIYTSRDRWVLFLLLQCSLMMCANKYIMVWWSYSSYRNECVKC